MASNKLNNKKTYKKKNIKNKRKKKKISSKKNHYRKYKINSKKKKLKGGSLQNSSSIDNPFNCLITKYIPQTNWVQYYSPLATSNFPIVKNGVLPHNNKYSWNQEG